MTEPKPRHQLVISTDLECSTCTADCPACAESGNQPEKGAKGVEICAAIGCNNPRDNWSPYCSEHTVSATRATPEAVTGVAPQKHPVEQVRDMLKGAGIHDPMEDLPIIPVALTPAPQPMSADAFWKQWCKETLGLVRRAILQGLPVLYAQFAEAYAAHQHAALIAERDRLLENPQVGTCCDCGAAIWKKEPRITENGQTYHPICRVIKRAEAAEARHLEAQRQSQLGWDKVKELQLEVAALRRLQGGEPDYERFRKCARGIAEGYSHTPAALDSQEAWVYSMFVSYGLLPAPPTAEPAKEGK